MMFRCQTDEPSNARSRILFCPRPPPPPPACHPSPPSPSLPGSLVGSKNNNCRQENTCHEPFERGVRMSERRGPARKGLGNRTKRSEQLEWDWRICEGGANHSKRKRGRITRKELENRRERSNLFEGTREREKEERTARKALENLRTTNKPFDKDQRI